MSGLAGGYVEQSGNAGGDRVIQVCRDSSQNWPADILVWGASLYMLADLLSMECGVVCVHPSLDVLERMQTELGQLLWDDDLVRRRLRTVHRPLEDGVNDLVRDKNISTIVLLGVLHHAPQPSLLLSHLLRGNTALVVLDTTGELIDRAVPEDDLPTIAVPQAGISSCKDAVVRVGLNNEADIKALLGESCVQAPRIFEYPLVCGWCRGKEVCPHSGVYSWLAVWGKIES